MHEIYKDLPGWEGIYKVSNFGNVASLDRVINGRFIKGRTLKPLKASQSLKVNLCTGTRSVSRTYTIGYLVMLAFVGEPCDGERARHRDGDYKNNRLDNLYWGAYERTGHA